MDHPRCPSLRRFLTKEVWPRSIALLPFRPFFPAALLVAISGWLMVGWAPDAEAGCTGPVAGVETCTGDVSGSHTFTAPTVSDLEVNSVTSGPSHLELSGTGSAPGDASNVTFTCDTSDGGSCSFGTNANNGTQTCSASGGAVCVPSAVDNGPSGNTGPSVLINVDAPTGGGVTVGAGGTGTAVIGSSTGSTGGNGSNSSVIGSGGDGGPGADGGTVVVNFTGVIPDGSYGGILAKSQGGNGGHGGSGGSVGGDGGAGGRGGFGGAATATFNAGSITVSGEGNVGITAISQGGNGGQGGDGGFFVSIGGSGEDAGKAGAAEVDTIAGTSISTSGKYGHGIAVYSLGGGGGSGAGGFGLFYSGGGGGSTGGNGGTATVNAAGAVTTTGDYAHGIFAQSIGGGGGNAGSTSALVALGGSGAARRHGRHGRP